MMAISCRRRFAQVAVTVALLLVATGALAEYKGAERVTLPGEKDLSGVLALNGEYVHNKGELQINITNWGLIGSRPGGNSSYSDAPSAMWPAGSGVDYLWAAGLWIGALKNGTPLVSTGQFTPEFIANPDDPLDDVYEMEQGEPGGARYPDPSFDDDDDGVSNEDPKNKVDDDGDGAIDEDFAAIGNQHFRCVYRDDTPLAEELFPDHDPIGLSVIQQSFQWENESVDDFVGFEFQVTNVGTVALKGVYLGFFADCDVGPRTGTSIAEDDLPYFFRGAVRANDGSSVPVSVAAMYDADGDNGQSPGYFGIMFLNHPTDPTGVSAPEQVGITSFQTFSGQAPFEKGGDPTNDAERYQLLSRKEFDTVPPEGEEGKANDFRILLSSGPFTPLETEESLTFQAAMVIGEGNAGLKRNAVEAALTFYGAYFNRDGDDTTGRQGRELLLCEKDFINPETNQNTLLGSVEDCGDSVDVAEGRADLITDDDMINFIGTEFYTCGANERGIWFNGDCDFEAGRRVGLGLECREESPAIDPADLAGCTGVGGKETRVPWLVGLAPNPPNMRLWEASGRVHIFWDNLSQLIPDVRLQEVDFESYVIWRAENWDRPFGSSIENGPESKLWSLIGQYDVVSYFEERRAGQAPRRMPLGANTGLDVISYVPAILRPGSRENIKFASLAQLIERIVAENTFLSPAIDPAAFMRYRDETGGVSDFGLEYPELADWQCCYDQVDSLYWSNLGVKWFEYVDRSVQDGLYYFYAVTATDFNADPSSGQLVPIGPGLIGDAQSNFGFAVPRAHAQTKQERDQLGQNIFVVPNPATRSALGRFSQLNPNEDDPTGVRVMWKNLPRAINTIKVYTLAGDLVVTIPHDGRGGDGSAFWNLVSRNGQEVVSGIYLYSVETDGSGFERVVGRFVIVR